MVMMMMMMMMWYWLSTVASRPIGGQTAEQEALESEILRLAAHIAAGGTPVWISRYCVI
jgi:hypothetical protein